MICFRNDLINVELMALKLTFKVFTAGIDIEKEEWLFTCFDLGEKSFENEVRVVFSMKTGADLRAYTKLIMLNSYFLLLDKLRTRKVFNNLVSKFEDGEALFFRTYWKAFKIISTNSIDSNASFDVDLCGCFDLLTGFFNHSCVPNVFIYRNQKSDVVHYVLLNDVKAGEELFIAYE